MYKRISMMFMILALSVSVHAKVVLPTTDVQQMYEQSGILTAIPTLFPLPIIAFTDLISGADIGLGDSLGSGAIVTVWGQRLGTVQGTSKIEFCDSASVCRVPHVYYWKDADGQLPSGPANLYESHGMQEVAISIPDSAQGAGTIKITTSEGYVETPFTVRAGDIYHVMSTGNDDTGDGSFTKPYLTIAKADGIIGAGSTLYVHDVTTGDQNTDQVIYNNNPAAVSTLAAQFAYVSYPNTRAEVIGYRGMSSWNASYVTGGIVAAKLSFYTAAADVTTNDQIINERNGTGTSAVTFAFKGTANGRAVGNYMTDEHISDTNGACASGGQGAIVAGANGADGVSNLKVLGNHVEEYGCAGSIKFQHTTYMSIRSGSDNLQLAPPEMSWNYLQDNHTKNGIHFYDENNSGLECGSFTGDVIISNNVIMNQSGSGINIGTNCPWTNDWQVYSNILVNVGLAAAWNGVDVSTSNGPQTSGINITDDGLTGTVYLFNNILIGWNADNNSADSMSGIGLQGIGDTVTIIANDNIIQTALDKKFVGEGCCGAEILLDNISGSGNVWFSSAGTSVNAIAPSWDSNAITTDPLLTITGSRISVGVGSPIIDKSNVKMSADIYGEVRQIVSNKGAVQ